MPGAGLLFPEMRRKAPGRAGEPSSRVRAAVGECAAREEAEVQAGKKRCNSGLGEERGVMRGGWRGSGKVKIRGAGKQEAGKRQRSNEGERGPKGIRGQEGAFR